MGIFVTITYKDEQNSFIKLQIYCELVFSFLAAVDVLWKRSSGLDFHITRVLTLGASSPVALSILPEERLHHSHCLSLSHGTATSSYHKEPPGGSQLLFLFHYLQIDLEFKIPIWASYE